MSLPQSLCSPALSEMAIRTVGQAAGQAIGPLLICGSADIRNTGKKEHTGCPITHSLKQCGEEAGVQHLFWIPINRASEVALQSSSLFIPHVIVNPSHDLKISKPHGIQSIYLENPSALLSAGHYMHHSKHK